MTYMNCRKLRREGEKLRRERLNRTLSLLAEEVPWLKESERRPDKSSILKLTVNYLKLNIGENLKTCCNCLYISNSSEYFH